MSDQTRIIDEMTDQQIVHSSEYAGKLCQLNGEPARISPNIDKFATVTNRQAFSKSFSWSTVHETMTELGGHFVCRD